MELPAKTSGKIEKQFVKKTSLFFVLVFFFSSLSLGQYIAKQENLVSRYKPGVGWFFSGAKPYEEGKLRKYDRLMIDITYDDWHGDRDYFTSPWNSLGFSVSWMNNIVLTKANTFSIGWGLGYSRFNNRSPLNIFHNDEEGFTQAVVIDPDDFPNEKRSFHANYIELPIEFRFRTKGYQHFKFMVGGKIGYQLSAIRRTTFFANQEGSGTKYTNKLVGFPDNNPLRYGVTARIGIRNYALFAAYYFSPIFQNEQSIQLTPLSVGLTISLF